jgi:tol-pal system protein YbgF
MNIGQKTEDRGLTIKVFFLPSFFCLLILSACATSSDLDAVRSSVTSLQLELSNQKKEISLIRNNISEVSKEIASIKSDLGSIKEYSLGAMKEGQSLLLTQMLDISKDVQSLKGQFDENKFFIDKTMKDILSERELLQAKIHSLENEFKELKAKTNSLAEKIDSAQQVLKTEEEKKLIENNPQKLYDDAITDYREKRYVNAIDKFEKFTKDYPQHIFASDAHFYLAESYFNDKKYEDAILAYETFLKKYPDNENTRKAMLKQAYAFIEIGDKKTAKVILERLIESFPKSNEAIQAEKKLSEITSKKVNTIKKKK